MEIVVNEILPKSPKGSAFCDKLGKMWEFEGWGKMGGGVGTGKKTQLWARADRDEKQIL